MRKDKGKQSIISTLESADIPMLLFVGISLGFLIVGAFYLTVGAFAESEEKIWSLKAILSGAISVGVSIVIGLIAVLYWWLVPRKSGTIFPKMNGFGLIGFVLAMFSGAMIGAELIICFLSN